MTRDDIIRMAKEAGFKRTKMHGALERFAYIVAAAERELVGLTDEEKEDMLKGSTNAYDAIERIEAKLKEKNGG
jgi:hypothetical protein